jgi:elongation factor 1-alpha
LAVRSRVQPLALREFDMTANSEKDHLSIVICGHVDSGKSTTTGRLIFELGGLPERELEKLKQEAERLGKGSFAFAFYMDRQKEERERGVTIACTTKAGELATRRSAEAGRRQ